MLPSLLAQKKGLVLSNIWIKKNLKTKHIPINAIKGRSLLLTCCRLRDEGSSRLE